MRLRFLAITLAAACGSGSGAPSDGASLCPGAFEIGDTQAGAQLGALTAGRLAASELPVDPSGLAVWEPGDFVLANDRVAMIIEDVDRSDQYDPWGGRPIGVALVRDGALVDPGAFGEILMLSGRYSVVTTSVSVVHDGADGQPAVIRAAGTPAPTPFIENIVGPIFREAYDDVPTAIEYELAAGADHVDVYIVHHSPRMFPDEQPIVLHGFMFTPRVQLYAPGHGFDADQDDVDWLGFIDDDGASWAYEAPGIPLGRGVSASGFVSVFGDGFTLAACGETRRHHARITVGGPGLDGLLEAVARREGTTLEAVSGTVTDATGAPAEGVRVHARAGDYTTRAVTDATGAYTVHLPAGATADFTAYRRGDTVVTGATPDLVLAPAGAIHVTTGGLPARVQVLPAGDSAIPEVPGDLGEPTVTGGRLHVAFPADGDVTLRAPVGEWRVVVSRGYEYELDDRVVTVSAGETVPIAATLPRVVATPDQQCADFHIHTIRSNDSGDDGTEKLLSAVADGVELPVRSEHEYVQSFQPEIEALGLEEWAFGVGSIEMTSMEIWGHMGVVPLEPDPTAVNAGAPLWQRMPYHDDLTTPVETMNPLEVFAAVRERPEQPTIIINHPRGGTNYFGYAGFDPVTGLPDDPEVWDTEFTAVEVFNDSGWEANRGGNVADWLSLLDHGRRVFAVGSSDSHGIKSSPVGYPRTCLYLGTDDPAELDANAIRDAVAGGRGTISGGIYVEATVGAAGPGGDATGVTAMAPVHVRVQAASWIDVDYVEIVVDGATAATIPITPDDADPSNPTIRFERDLLVDVAETGSYVIVAASGDATLEPVHPGRVPFGVTNPIFLTR